MNISKQITLVQCGTTWIISVSAILFSYTESHAPHNNANKLFPVLSKVTICLHHHYNSTSWDSIRCRVACQISDGCDHFNIQSRDFKTWRKSSYDLVNRSPGLHQSNTNMDLTFQYSHKCLIHIAAVQCWGFYEFHSVSFCHKWEMYFAIKQLLCINGDNVA